MNTNFPYPFQNTLNHLNFLPKLPVHSGIASFQSFGEKGNSLTKSLADLIIDSGHPVQEPEKQEYEAIFLVPMTGNCHIFLSWKSDVHLNNNFGEGLVIQGKYNNQQFKMACPSFYVKDHALPSDESKWAHLIPVNHPVTIEYGEQTPTKKVRARINNFHFTKDPKGPVDDKLSSGLQVIANDCLVDFYWVAEWKELLHILKTKISTSGSLFEFEFHCWEGSTEGDWIQFAQNISSLCNYALGQLCGIPIITFFDESNRPVKRILFQAIESKFRSDFAFPSMTSDHGIPRLFSNCFSTHIAMQQDQNWQRFNQLFSSIEDNIFLETKFGLTMSAVELIIRNSLLEKDSSPNALDGLTDLGKLIGAARKKLGWEIPTHYTQDERFRITRNAVQHGDALPYDPKQTWEDFAKWKLFLLRRILSRLGFDGHVSSVKQGWFSISEVHDFTEENNSFEKP